MAEQLTFTSKLIPAAKMSRTRKCDVAGMRTAGHSPAERNNIIHSRTKPPLSVAEAGDHIETVIDGLERGGAMLQMLASKKANLTFNQGHALFSTDYMEGLQSELFEFNFMGGDFLDDAEDLETALEDARRSHRPVSELKSDLRLLMEQQLSTAILKSTETELHRVEYAISQVRQRPVMGFLTSDAQPVIDELYGSSLTIRDAGRILSLKSFLEAQLARLFSGGGAVTSVRLAHVTGFTPTGESLSTFIPRALGIYINPYNGTVKNLFRNKQTRPQDITTAMRMLQHAIEQEELVEAQKTRKYTELIDPVFSVIGDSISRKTQLDHEHMEEQMISLQKILRDIGRGVIRDHSKKRAAYRLTAAVRLLNSTCINGPAFSLLARIAGNDIAIAKEHLEVRRQNTVSIAYNLKLKYASLSWHSREDEQKHSYLRGTIDRASEMLSIDKAPHDRLFAGARNILAQLHQSRFMLSYYGYRRAKTRLAACAAILDEIDHGIQRVLYPRSTVLGYSYKRYLDDERSTAVILSKARRSDDAGRDQFAAYCMKMFARSMKVLSGRDFARKNTGLRKDLEIISDKIGRFQPDDAPAVNRMLSEFRTAYLPQNGSGWQQYGFTIATEALGYLEDFERVMTCDAGQTAAVIQEHLTKTQRSVSGLIAFALCHDNALADTVERNTSSIIDNLDHARLDIKNRAVKE